MAVESHAMASGASAGATQTGARCLIYARVSSEDQIEQYGIPLQLRACRESAARFGYQVLEEIVDEGISGATMDRPGLQRMRALVRERAAEVVLAYDVDRISRELVHLLILKPEIERHARLEFVLAKFEDSPTGRMFFGIRGVIAQYDREHLLERTLRGRREKARAGHIVGGRIPYGYSYLGRAAGERGRYVINQEQAEVVRQIFDWAGQGASIREIARRLNASGTAPSRAERWGKSSVARILASELYAGLAHYNRRKRDGTVLRMRPESDWIALAVPAIVDRASWLRVAARLQENRRMQIGRPSRRYLLRGLLYCACGKRMSGEPGHGSPAYRCSARCGRPQVPAGKLDTAVWSAVEAPFASTETLGGLVERHYEALTSSDANDRAAKLRQDLERCKAREARAVRALLDLPDYDAVKRQLVELRNCRRRMEADLAELSVPPDATLSLDAIVAEMRYALGGLTVEGRQEFLRRCVERIVLDGRAVQIQCFFVARNRPQRENVVSAGGSHFESALGAGLAANVGKIGLRCAGGGVAVQMRPRRLKLVRTAQERDHLGKMAHRKDVDAFDDGSLGGIFRRKQQVRDAVGARAHGHRERAAYGTDGAVEREFSYQQMTVETFYGAHCAEDSHRHREIETGSLFADVSGSQIDRYGLAGPTKAGVDQRRLDTFAALPNRRVGHTDSNEIARRAELVQIDFDINQVSINAENRSAEGLEQRHAGKLTV
jgi:site-specific DNA recombinase